MHICTLTYVGLCLCECGRKGKKWGEMRAKEGRGQGERENKREKGRGGGPRVVLVTEACERRRGQFFGKRWEE